MQVESIFDDGSGEVTQFLVSQRGNGWGSQ
jgi:hypothetical protein